MGEENKNRSYAPGGAILSKTGTISSTDPLALMGTTNSSAMIFSFLGGDVIELANAVEQAMCHGARRRISQSKRLNFIRIGTQRSQRHSNERRWELSL